VATNFGTNAKLEFPFLSFFHVVVVVDDDVVVVDIVVQTNTNRF
jgi:hypothetical protein